MPSRDLIASVALLGTGLLAIFVVIPAETRAGGGGVGAMSPALVPTAAAATVALLAALLLIQQLLAPPPATEGWPRTVLPRPRRAAAVGAALVGGGLLMDHVATWAGLTLVIGAAMIQLGEARLLRLIAVASVTIATIYLLAELGLGTSLP